MSYYTQQGGAATFGGFGYYGLSGALPIMRRDEDTLELQQELVRLRFLQPTQDRFGADGIWGPRTAGALMSAARYVNWTSAPFSPPNADQMRSGQVSVPDDLIERLRAASPAPHGTPGSVGTEPPAAEPPVEPVPDALPSPAATMRAPQSSGWVPAAAIGGVVLAIGGFIAWQMSPGKKKRVRANRRRKRRRSSRRR